MSVPYRCRRSAHRQNYERGLYCDGDAFYQDREARCHYQLGNFNGAIVIFDLSGTIFFVATLSRLVAQPIYRRPARRAHARRRHRSLAQHIRDINFKHLKSLELIGYKTFIQAWDIRPGANFVLAMQAATESADRTIAVLSPDYPQAKFTQPEWGSAFAQDPTGEQGLLVPVKVRNVELRGQWVAIVYIDLVGLTEEQAKQALLDGLSRGRAKPHQPIAYPAYPAEQPPSSPPTKFQPTYPIPVSAERDPLFGWTVFGADKDSGPASSTCHAIHSAH